MAYYYKALEIDPHSSSALSDFFLTLNYVPASRETIFMEHCKFGQFDITPASAKPSASPLKLRGEPSPRGGVITLAYISADFHEHPVAHLIVPILRHHDRSKFKIILYSNV